jgi:hypothetical protein
MVFFADLPEPLQWTMPAQYYPLLFDLGIHSIDHPNPTRSTPTQQSSEQPKPCACWSSQ